MNMYMNIYHTHKAKNVTSYDTLSPLSFLAPIPGHHIRLSSFSEELGWTLSDTLWWLEWSGHDFEPGKNRADLC